ncbi:MAG: PIG-L family deacetylase [Christensenellaceae bacterium]|jgi:LmbE family N-acetylglucosaminyl deacetylase|nr:PIG-L family deacetylase [Christensenellaceae bacterium]
MKINSMAQVYTMRECKCSDLVIAAHHDDIEIMCPHGIIACKDSTDKGLVAVIVSDGAGSPRTGAYANFTDEEMKLARIEEQKRAAELGNYAALLLLKHSSATIKDKGCTIPTDDLEAIILKYNPDTIHIHNLADKHPTHVACAVRSIQAIRRLPIELRPAKLYGCEVWRGLDWLSDKDKVVFDLTGQEQFLKSLLSVFETQVAGCKRYDIAAEGRRVANATYSSSHAVDICTSAAYAMDLTLLIQNDNIDPRDYIMSKIDDFKSEILI